MSQELSAEALAIIEKVQKLLALAGNNPNEHEAASASAKALELLAAYNLDMLTVDRNAGRTGKRSDEKLAGGLYRWQRDLWRACAQLHFCMYWSIKGLRKGQSYEHRILGRQENVIACKVMAEYLQQTIERLARERVEGVATLFFTKSSISFREGMGARITERLEDLRRDRIEEDKRKKAEEAARAKHPGVAPGTSLVLADAIQAEHDANMDHLYGEGWSARRRAEQAKANKDWEEHMAKVQAEREAWIKANPEEHAKQQAQEKADYERWKKREARNAARRRPAIWRPTKQYKGDYEAYGEGYRKGASVGLDQQVAHNPTKKL